MSVVSLWEDQLARLEHVAAVQRDYSVNPLIGSFFQSIFGFYAICVGTTVSIAARPPPFVFVLFPPLALAHIDLTC
jgi:hypothetical protein